MYSNRWCPRILLQTYLALVEGEFPSAEDWLPCSAPLGVLCHKFGIQRVLSESEGGKEAHTCFRRRHFDPQRNVSVVECQPRTGRTHQIRVHLQFLGHPIVNDPIYNCLAWGPAKGKDAEFGKPVEAVIEELGRIHSWEQHVLEEGEDEEKEEGPDEKRLRLDEPFPRDPHCRGCRTAFKDPSPESLRLFLHAFQYEGPSWTFRSALPDWAQFET